MKPKTILISFLAAALPGSLLGQVCPTANPVVVTTAGNTGQSLRWAIGCLNSVTPLTTIQFNIPGAGPHIIQPNATAGFPNLTKNNAVISGGAEQIILDGSLTIGNGLTIAASNTSVSGLTIRNFSGSGITLNTGSGNQLTNNLLTGNGEGITVDRSASTATISNNTIDANLGDAIFVQAALPTGAPPAMTITGNTITNNRGIGVNAANARLIRIADNRFSCNLGGGIQRAGTPPSPQITVVSGNSIMGTGSAGALIQLFSFSNATCPSASCQGTDIVGTATVDATGNWSVSNPGLAIGTQLTATQTVNDNNTSEFSACETVTVSCASFSANGTAANVRCRGESSGAITLQIGGGQSPYQIGWSTGQTATSLTNLPAGAYQVTIQDANSCEATLNFTIAQPSALGLILTGTDPSCFGVNNGQINALASGGLAPYSYLWSTGGTASSISQLAAGTYSLTLTDRNGCTLSRSDTLAQPSALAISVVSKPESAPGKKDGSVQATPSGGIGPYQYLWSTGSSASAIGGLPSGAYQVTVTDGKGCVGTAQATVISAACAGFAVQVTALQGSCEGGFDGSARAGASGANGQVQYAWSNGQTGQEAGQLAPGKYAVTAADALGCSASAQVEIAASGRVPKPVYGLTAPDSVCGNNPILLRADDLFPGPGVRYRWQFPDGREESTGVNTYQISHAKSKDTGEYFVARDSGGCVSVFFGPVLIDVLSLEGLRAGPDTALCQDARVALRGSVPAQGTAVWTSLQGAAIENPNAPNTFATGLKPGLNQFVWKVALGICPEAASDTASIYLEKRPQLADDFYQIERIQEVAGMNVLLNDDLSGVLDTVIAGYTNPVSGILTYLDPRRSFLYTAEPEFRGRVTFQYIVCNPDAACFAPCDSAQVEIEVLNLPDPAEGLILEDPGLNGQWVIKGLSGFTRVEARILNRWGDVVYETEQYRNEDPWAGRRGGQGSYVPPGTYYYVLQAYDGAEKIGKPQTGALYVFMKKMD